MKPYRTNLRDVPYVEGLSPRDGWINMQVQFLIDEKTADSDKLVLGWTVLPPGARHDRLVLLFVDTVHDNLAVLFELPHGVADILDAVLVGQHGAAVDSCLDPGGGPLRLGRRQVRRLPLAAVAGEGRLAVA